MMKRKSTLITALLVCISLLLISPGIEAGKPTTVGNSLNVAKRTQEHSNWCWDGSSQCVLYYFGQTPSQCEIANYAWKRSDCCSSNVFDWYHPCNQGNYLFGRKGNCQQILANWGVDSSGVNGSLSWNDVISDIDSGLPFIMGWYWTYGGGHALVGHAYNIKNNTQYVSYMDPWPGEGFSTSTYSYVVSASDHQWGQTLRTK
jgi:Peptidase_C39 like family